MHFLSPFLKVHTFPHFDALPGVLEVHRIASIYALPDLRTLNINSNLVLEVQNIGSKLHFQPKVYFILEVQNIGSKMHFQPKVQVLVISGSGSA